jgi:hypothetical protein
MPDENAERGDYGDEAHHEQNVGGCAADAGAAGRLVEITVPLATLQRVARSAGENRLLGSLDPALTRDLAAAAARSAYSRWAVTIVDGDGYAIGHGVARRTTRGPTPGSTSESASGSASSLHALAARVNITITESRLRELAVQGSQPSLSDSAPGAGAPPGDWAFRPRKAAELTTWTLILPGGRELAVRFDVVPTHECDHRYQSDSYQPSQRLRRLVQVRDYECTFPTCSRPAHESDFEHGVPFAQGGKTDACNAGARSRRCHQVKQAPGWMVTQPKPGWHVWTTPTGRSYVQEPWRYAV